MAQTLKLSRTGSSDINLVNASGWFLTDPGWVPQIGEEFGPPVQEALKIQSNFTSQDNIAAAMVALNKLRTYAARSAYDRQEAIVWLVDQLSSETGQRQAAVRALRLQQLAEQHGVGGGDAGSMVDLKPGYNLGILREPYWERTTARDMPYLAPAVLASLAYDYTAAGAVVTAHDIVGDVGARIGLLSIAPTSELGKLWIGLRSARKHGTLANFIPIWECESGVNGTDAQDHGDADASGDAVVQVTPGTATWANRLALTLATFSANEVDNFGTYLWLLRCWVTSGTWEVQLRFGYDAMDSDDMVLGPKRVISWTAGAARCVEGGVASIPLRDLQAMPTATVSADLEAGWTIEIWARRLTGSGLLELDCVLPVPLDEGWLKVWDLLLTSSDFVYFAESPFGKTMVCTNQSNIGNFPPFVAHNFELPPGDGRMIIVPEQDGGGLIEQILINGSDVGKYTERWLSLRGAE